MFDIEADHDVTISGFEIYTFRDEYQETEKAEIWTRRNGSYVGGELREIMWTKVMNLKVGLAFNMRRIVLQLDYPVRISANEKQAFYVTIEGEPRCFRL